MVYKELTWFEFEKEFRDCGRENQFSYSALAAIYKYLDVLSDETGEPYILDVIEICCNFTEYSSLKELQEDYPDIESLEDLESRTTYIPVNDDCFVIENL